jgi:hypothetical protein
MLQPDKCRHFAQRCTGKINEFMPGEARPDKVGHDQY